jgi:hypothetical protein
MLLHVAIILLQVAALVAFLIVWYFWAKKKLLCSFMVDDEQQVLFPFRYFSWILLGVVLVTCLAQVHFIRSSSQFQDKLAALTTSFQKQEHAIRSLQGFQGSVDKLRKELSSIVVEIRSQHAAYMSQTSQRNSLLASASRVASDLQEGLQASPSPGDGFSGEAKAAGSNAIKGIVADPKPSPAAKDDTDAFSMRLNRLGEVTAAALRVRKKPTADGAIIEKLASGEQVKVTEKRLSKDAAWFRVITPSGRAGWVDFRFVKLGGET